MSRVLRNRVIDVNKSLHENSVLRNKSAKVKTARATIVDSSDTSNSVKLKFTSGKQKVTNKETSKSVISESVHNQSLLIGKCTTILDRNAKLSNFSVKNSVNTKLNSRKTAPSKAKVFTDFGSDKENFFSRPVKEPVKTASRTIKTRNLKKSPCKTLKCNDSENVLSSKSVNIIPSICSKPLRSKKVLTEIHLPNGNIQSTAGKDVSFKSCINLYSDNRALQDNSNSIVLLDQELWDKTESNFTKLLKKTDYECFSAAGLDTYLLKEPKQVEAPCVRACDKFVPSNDLKSSPREHLSRSRKIPTRLNDYIVNDKGLNLSKVSATISKSSLDTADNNIDLTSSVKEKSKRTSVGQNSNCKLQLRKTALKNSNKKSDLVDCNKAHNIVRFDETSISSSSNKRQNSCSFDSPRFQVKGSSAQQVTDSITKPSGKRQSSKNCKESVTGSSDSFISSFPGQEIAYRALTGKHIPVYKSIRKSPPLTMEAKEKLYCFETDENEEPVPKKKKRFMRTQKVRRRARIYVRHNQDKKSPAKGRKQGATVLMERNILAVEDDNLFEPVQDDVMDRSMESVIASVDNNEVLKENSDPADQPAPCLTFLSPVRGSPKCYSDAESGIMPKQSTPAQSEVHGISSPAVSSAQFSNLRDSPIIASHLGNSSASTRAALSTNNRRSVTSGKKCPRFSDVDKDILVEESYSPLPVYAAPSVHEVSYTDVPPCDKASCASQSLLCQTPRAAWDDHVSYRYCSTPVRDNSFNVSAISIGSPAKPSIPLDASTCFGFDVPDEVEEVLVSPIKNTMPARLNVAPIHPHSEESLPPVSEVLSILRKDVGDSPVPTLFDPDVDFSPEPPSNYPDDSSGCFMERTRRSYDRPLHRRRKDSEHSEEALHLSPPPSPIPKAAASRRRKRQPGPSRKEQEELDNWAAAFNNQCAEISTYNLCIE